MYVSLDLSYHNTHTHPHTVYLLYTISTKLCCTHSLITNLLYKQHELMYVYVLIDISSPPLCRAHHRTTHVPPSDPPTTNSATMYICTTPPTYYRTRAHAQIDYIKSPWARAVFWYNFLNVYLNHPGIFIYTYNTEIHIPQPPHPTHPN